MKTLLSIVLALLAATAGAQNDITPGQTFSDGQRLTAAQLTALVNQAVINTTFYTAKTPGPTNLQEGDILLAVLAAGGQYHKMLGSSVIKNPLLISDQIPYTTLLPFYSVAIYDPTNNQLGQIPVNTFGVQSLNFSNALSEVSPLPWGYDLTNQIHFVVYGTNGLPESLSMSNLEIQEASDFGTNLFLPYVYQQIFYPWQVYGTNQWGTNLWGATNVFAITNLYMFAQTNNTPTNNTSPQTLTNTDTVPVNAFGQRTNTVMTLGALGEWLTNNFPAIVPVFSPAQARIQFCGHAASFPATNVNGSRNTLIPTNFPFSGVSAVSFNHPPASGITGIPTITTNQVYYIVPTNAIALEYYLFTNYSQAYDYAQVYSGGAPKAATLTSATVPGGASMLYITNFTSFNCDAIQTVQGSGAVLTGEYQVFFRTNTLTTLYYTSGTLPSKDFGGGAQSGSTITTVNGPPLNSPATNFFTIFTQDAGGVAIEYTPVQVIVNPQ